MIKVMPGGELRDQVKWTLDFEFYEGMFWPDNLYVKKFSDLGGKPANGNKTYLSLTPECSFKAQSMFSKCDDKEGLEVVVVVGICEAAKIFLPYGVLVKVELDLNPMQAFKFDYVYGEPKEGDRIGIMGELRRPVQ